MRLREPADSLQMQIDGGVPRELGKGFTPIPAIDPLCGSIPIKGAGDSLKGVGRSQADSAR